MPTEQLIFPVELTSALLNLKGLIDRLKPRDGILTQCDLTLSLYSVSKHNIFSEFDRMLGREAKEIQLGQKGMFFGFTACRARVKVRLLIRLNAN